MLALWSLSTGAQALELSLPDGAELTRKIEEPRTIYAIPTGRWTSDVVPTKRVEGQLLLRAWRLDAQGLSTLDVISNLRDQFVNSGMEVLLDCSARQCGGFDFRFNTRILPAPDMFVDLRDFRFLSAKLTQDDSGYISVLISRAGESLYVQLIEIAPPTARPTEITAQPRALPEAPGSVTEAMLTQGHVILADLEFESGSSSLADAPYGSLDALARFLKADPRRRIALVGHTDAVGGLEGNVALSRARAASVLARLAERHGVPPEQMESSGMGYLAPVAPNTTDSGREANRRVEAVLLSLD